MPLRTAFDVIPTDAALGAEVRGVDLRAVDDAAFAAIHRTWLEHQVLLIRDQSLSDQDLIASAAAGALDQAPIQENGASSTGVRRFM
jgi:taurine dioxygenase